MIRTRLMAVQHQQAYIDSSLSYYRQLIAAGVELDNLHIKIHPERSTMK